MLTHISTSAPHKTCPQHRNIWPLYTGTAQDMTQTSILAHVDITDCTDDTTLLTSWTHFSTQIMMVMSKSDDKWVFKPTPKAKKHS